MTNPLTEMRMRLNMTMRELAIALDVAYSVVHSVESGLARTIPRRICEGLDQLGEDADAIVLNYQCWRQSVGNQLRREAR